MIYSIRFSGMFDDEPNKAESIQEDLRNMLTNYRKEWYIKSLVIRVKQIEEPHNLEYYKRLQEKYK